MSRSPAGFTEGWGVVCHTPSDRFSAGEKLLQSFEELIHKVTIVLNDFTINRRWDGHCGIDKIEDVSVRILASLKNLLSRSHKT